MERRFSLGPPSAWATRPSPRRNRRPFRGGDALGVTGVCVHARPQELQPNPLTALSMLLFSSRRTSDDEHLGHDGSTEGAFMGTITGGLPSSPFSDGTYRPERTAWSSCSPLVFSCVAAFPGGPWLRLRLDCVLRDRQCLHHREFAERHRRQQRVAASALLPDPKRIDKIPAVVRPSFTSGHVSDPRQPPDVARPNELHLHSCDPVALSSNLTEELRHVRRLALKT